MREPEDDDAGAVEADDREQRPSRMARDRPAGKDHGGDGRSHGRRGTQQPEPRRPDVEHVLREDGKQRDGASEEDCEEIEGDGPEQDGRRPHEANAAEDAREVRRGAARGLPAGVEQKHTRERDERERRGDRVDELLVDGEDDARRSPARR